MKNHARMLLFGLALPCIAFAQNAMSASLAINHGFDSTKKFTGNSNGLTFDVAYDLEGTLPLRFGLGRSNFQSGTRDYAEIDNDGAAVRVPGEGITLEALQAYAGLRTQPIGKLMMSFSLSMNRIRLGYADRKEMVKGWKGGARLDLEYPVSKQLSTTLGFQVVEVGLDELQTALVSPSWLQVGVRYQF